MTTIDPVSVVKALDAVGDALEALAGAFPHQGVHDARDRFREAWPKPADRQDVAPSAQVLTTAAVGGGPPATTEPEASGDEPPAAPATASSSTGP